MALTDLKLGNFRFNPFGFEFSELLRFLHWKLFIKPQENTSMTFSMCEKSCKSWTGRLPSVKDFDWLKENYIPKEKLSNLRSKRFPYKIAINIY